MHADHTGSAERRDERDAAGHEKHPLFPYHAVVGIVDEPSQLESAADRLFSEGFGDAEIQVICGREGVERIDPEGKNHGLLARLFRIVDWFGEEHDHSKRHADELRKGHYLVGVEAHDDGAKTRAHDALRSSGAHFINYYSRWTAETLTP